MSWFNLFYIPLGFLSILFYKMIKDYIEVSYHEKLKKKLN